MPKLLITPLPLLDDAPGMNTRKGNKEAKYRAGLADDLGAAFAGMMVTRFRYVLKWAVLALLAMHLGTAQSWAQDMSRPDPIGTPTQVSVRTFIIDIDGVSSVDQNYTANIFYEASWLDPRLKPEDGKARAVLLKEIWHPALLILNQQRLIRSLPETAMVDPEGRVAVRQRVWGQFSQRMDLHDFPFDQQTFEFHLISVYGSAEVYLRPADELSHGISEVISLADWSLKELRIASRAYEPIPGALPRTSIVVAFDLKRESSYFTIKVLIPLCLVVAMSWIAFWIDPKFSNVQIGAATTTMLTLIAYRFAIGSNLPNIPYVTRMDGFVMLSTVLVFLTLVESVFTAHLSDTDRLEEARRIDRIARVVFPTAFAVVGLWTLVL